jgi:cytochrome c biogenesis protein CcmG/thiol:disulfide interchange protein DsbE
LFRLENVRPGQPDVELADYRGTPVVVNFWASWCVPCRRELPGFAAVSKELEGKLAFLGVNHQDGRGPALDFLQETGLHYPSGFDPKGDVAASYGLLGMPTTVFVSPDGKLLERRTGEISRKELEETIERLFRVASSSP